MSRVATMTERDDPWSRMRAPTQTSALTSRLVSSEIPWDLFWAIDLDSDCLLVLEHQWANAPPNRLPSLRGLEVVSRKLNEERGLVVVRLKEREQREIFHRLCLDVIQAMRNASTEAEAVERFVARTWRWHRLLRNGRDERLSPEEQKGLIGELHVLEEILMPVVGASSALNSWQGPMGSPKDFEVGPICIEAKARRGASAPHVSISNEHQLDTMSVEALYLHVSDISQATESDEKGMTLTERLLSLRTKIESTAPSTLQLFDERLLACGFDWEDDYADCRWLIGAQRVFGVIEGFPCIAANNLVQGISGVRYSVDLQACDQYRVEVETLIQRIRGDLGGDKS